MRRRDRHDRGLRGPLALPNKFTSKPVPLRRSSNRSTYFGECVTEAVMRINQTCPDALAGVDIGIEEVPQARWTDSRVPLAIAIESTIHRSAQIVIFRRPLEHRSDSRRALRALVHRTLVEQLSALTGRSVDEIDPSHDPDDD